MTDTNIPTSVVLDRAADLIEERGWTQGNRGWLALETGPLCLEGAIATAAAVPASQVAYDAAKTEFYFNTAALEACPASRAVAEYLDHHHGGAQSWRWNDQRDRTAAEVIEVLRAAALIEAARERADVHEVVPA